MEKYKQQEIDRAVEWLCSNEYPQCGTNIARFLNGARPLDQHEIDELNEVS